MSTGGEVDSLKVLLLGDGTGFQEVIDDAVGSAGEGADKIKEEAERAEAEQNAMLREAARLIAAVATPTERYAEQVASVNKMLQAGAISQEIYNRAVAQAADILPKDTFLEQEAALVKAQAAAITEAAMLPTEQYAAKIADLDGFLARGAITQETYNRSVENLLPMLPEVVELLQEAKEAEREATSVKAQAAAITNSVLTPTEQYAKRVNDLNGFLVRGAISQETYNRAVAQARQILPEVIASNEAAARAQEEVDEATARAAQLTRSLQTPLEQYAERMRELNALQAAGYISQETYTRGVKQLKAEFETLHATMNRVASGFTSVGQSLSNAGRMMTFALTGPIALMGFAAVRAHASFDDAMTKSIAIMDDVSDAQRKVMEAQAKAVAVDYAQQPEAVAKSYYYLASAGMNASQSVESLSTVARFATAGQFEMARATELLSDSQKALGLNMQDPIKNMKEMGRVGDVLVKAGTSSNATVEQFAEALTNKAATAARTYNRSLEETVATLAVFADRGKKGAEAGELYAIAMRDLQHSVEKEPQVWREFGLSVYDAQGAMRPMSDIIGQLETRFAGMSDEQKKVGFSMLGFQERSLMAVLALMGSSKEIERYQKVLESAGGTMDKVAKTQLTSFAAQMRIVGIELKNAGDEIGTILAPMLNKVAGYIKEAVTWFHNLSESQREVVVYAALVVAAFGPVTMIIGKIHTGIGTLIKTLDLLIVPIETIIGLISGAIGISAGWVAGIGIAVAALGILAAAISGVDLGQVWTNITNSVKSFVDKSIGFFANFRANWAELVRWVGSNWQDLLLDLGGFLVATLLASVHNSEVALETLVRMFMAWEGWMASLFEQVFTLDFLKFVWQGIKAAASAIGDFAKSAWKSLKAIFTGDVDSMDGKAMATKLAGDFEKGLTDKNILKSWKDIIADESKNIQTPFDTFKSRIQEGPNFAYAWGQDTGKKAGDGLTEGMDNAMRSHAKNAEAFAEPILTGAAKAVQELTDKLKEQIGTFGMLEGEKEIYKLRQQYKELTDADLESVLAMGKRLRAMEDNKKAQEKAQALMEKWQSPAEKYVEKMDELDALFKQGKLSQEAYNHESQELHKELDKGFHVRFETHGLDAALKGSAEAQRTFEATQESFRQSAVADLAVEQAKQNKIIKAAGIDPEKLKDRVAGQESLRRISEDFSDDYFSTPDPDFMEFMNKGLKAQGKQPRFTNSDLIEAKTGTRPQDDKTADAQADLLKQIENNTRPPIGERTIKVMPADLAWSN